MPSPTPRARLRRLAVLALPVLAILIMAHVVQSAARAGAQTEGTVHLSPAMSTVPLSDGPFTVYVVLEDLQHFGQVTYDDDRDGTPDRQIPSEGLAAFQFTIEYDAAVVEVDSVEEGPHLGSTGRSFQCLPLLREPGNITFGCLSSGSSPPGAQGTLTLASVQLTPISNGLSPLVLSAEVAGPLGDSADVEVGGGAVRVTGASGATRPPPTRANASPTVPVATARPPTALPRTTTSESATATAESPRTPGTPAGTSTPLLTSAPTPPDGPPDDPNGDGFARAWLWVLGVAGVLALAGGGLTAILWQHRSHGGA